jgi:MoxR-like ATPase
MAPTKLAAIRDELSGIFLERTDLIQASVAALASKQHVLVIGPPGTAKSMLAEEITRRIDGAQLFMRLVNKFSVPEELLGPYKMSALKEDRYSRNFKGYLPDSDIAFLDEIYKANSAVLNAILRIINERKFEDDGQELDVPLRTLFAASNELPEGEELGALHDRLLVRIVVDYVQEASNFMKLITMDFDAPRERTTITLEELDELQARVAKVILPEPIARDIKTLKDQLHNDGVVPGDRRWQQAVKLIKGNAVVEGRDSVTEDDIALLRHCLWLTPVQIRPVHRAVLAIASPNEREALEILDQIDEIRAGVVALAGAPDASKSKQGLEFHTKLKKLNVRLGKMREDSLSAGRATVEIDRARARAASTIQTVLQDVLGLDVEQEKKKEIES